MQGKELVNLLEQYNAKPGDFIRYAKELGVSVHGSTVSRHQKANKIGPGWSIAYRSFFNYLDRVKEVL